MIITNLPETSPMDILLKLLSTGRFDYTNEKDCQDQIATFLSKFNIHYVQEFRLGNNSICDFYFPRSRLVLEVKAFKSWSKLEVFRQCERYLQYEDVDGLILATGKIQGMPLVINNKPVKVLQLSLGFMS